MFHTLLDFDLHIYEHISTHRMCHITLGFQYIWKPWNHIWIYWLYNLVLHVTQGIFNHIFLVLYGRKYNTNIYKSIYNLLIVQFFFQAPFFYVRSVQKRSIHRFCQNPISCRFDLTISGKYFQLSWLVTGDLEASILNWMVFAIPEKILKVFSTLWKPWNHIWTYWYMMGISSIFF